MEGIFRNVQNMGDLMDRATAMSGLCSPLSRNPYPGRSMLSDSIELCAAATKLASEFNKTKNAALVKSAKFASAAKMLLAPVHDWFLYFRKYGRPRSVHQMRVFSELLSTSSRMLECSAVVLRSCEYLGEEDSNTQGTANLFLNASADLKIAANIMPATYRTPEKCNIYNVHSKYIVPVKKLLDDRIRCKPLNGD